MESIFDYDIDRIARNVMNTAFMYEVTYDVAWREYIHRGMKERVTFEEVLSYIYEKLSPIE
jgi:hypothetical protein